jgi:hypothetical protein
VASGSRSSSRAPPEKAVASSSRSLPTKPPMPTGKRSREAEDDIGLMGPPAKLQPALHQDELMGPPAKVQRPAVKSDDIGQMGPPKMLPVKKYTPSMFVEVTR